MTNMPDDQMAPAIDAVAAACRVARSVQQDLARVRQITKDDRSPVTVADFAVQAIVAMALRDSSADVLIVGEEHAGMLRQPEHEAVRCAVVEAVRMVHADATEDDVIDAIDACDHDGAAEGFWTLDPIDGTKGFLRGEQYAIALGLLEHGRVVLGVLGCPNLPGPDGQPGCLLTATRGGGAQIRPLAARGRDGAVDIRVSDITDTSAARFCESVESGHSDQDQSAQIAAALGITQEPVRVDSQCKYAIVGQGQAQIYLRLPTRKDYREKIWDHAAGLIVVEEAGGRVTDARGNDLDFGHGRQLENNSGVIATNGPIHDEVLKTVAQFVDLS